MVDQHFSLSNHSALLQNYLRDTRLRLLYIRSYKCLKAELNIWKYNSPTDHLLFLSDKPSLLVSPLPAKSYIKSRLQLFYAELILVHSFTRHWSMLVVGLVLSTWNIENYSNFSVEIIFEILYIFHVSILE